MTKKKKVGCFFAAILVLPISILVQYLVMIPMTGFTAIGILSSNLKEGIPASALAMQLYEVVSGDLFTDILQIVYSVAVIALFGWWLRAEFKKDAKPALKKGKTLLVFLIGLFLLMIGLQYLTEIVYEGIAAVSPQTAEDYEMLTEMAGMDEPTPLMYLYVVVLGPIGEELMFRGVVLKNFRRIMPFAFANILQAVLFGIYHMNVMQSLYTIVAGLLFGLIAEKGGRMMDSILAHMMFNLLGITGLLYLWADNPYFQFVWMPVMVLTLILGSMMLFPGDEKAAEA